MSMTFSGSSPRPSRASRFADLLSRWMAGVLFGEQIQAMRQEKGLSIEECAQLAGFTVERWEAIEDGVVPENWQQACAVADGLKVDSLEMASLIVRHAGAWEKAGQNLPEEIRQMYS